MAKDTNEFPLPLRSMTYRGRKHLYFTCEIGNPRFSEVDSYNVVWNGHYVNYMEHARMALCRQSGFDLQMLSRLGYCLPVHRYDVTMRKPILPGEAVTVGVRLKSSCQGFFEFEHLVTVGREVRAVGQVTHILVDQETLTPQYGLPETIANVFKPLLEMFRGEAKHEN